MDTLVHQGNMAGYHVAAHASLRTMNDGLSAGVLAASPWQHPLDNIEMPDIVSTLPGERFIARIWYGPCPGGIAVISIYFHTGEGAEEKNVHLRLLVTGWIRAYGRPFIIGADWQCSSKTLTDSGWP